LCGLEPASVISTVAEDWNGDPSTLLKPSPSPTWSDCDFWCADERAFDQLLWSGLGVKLFANCDKGLPICIEVAVLVASETFMSLVENAKEEVSCVKGDDRGCDGN
jgi:hypothetical protein